MPPPLGIDFARRPRRPSAFGGLLLACGVAATMLVLREHGQLDERVAGERARLAQFRHGVAKTASVPSPPTAPLSEGEIRPAVAVARVLQRDWLALFGALETAMADPGVALLSVEQDAARGPLKLAGEARNLPEVFALIHRLESGGVLRDVRLANYDFRSSGSVQVVGFVLGAHWEGGP